MLHSFAIASAGDGSLTREAFDKVMRRYVRRSSARVDVVLSSVFDAFDRDGNGLVDFTELATGVTLLCGGDRAKRLRAAFALYDANGDGCVGSLLCYVGMGRGAATLPIVVLTHRYTVHHTGS